MVTPCEIRIHAYLELPGSNQMYAEDGFQSPTPHIRWHHCPGAGCGYSFVCGIAGQGQINRDYVDTYLQTTASCADLANTNWSLNVISCEAASGCDKSLLVELPGPGLQKALGCTSAPPLPTCDECQCKTGGGNTSASPNGIGTGAAPDGSGPKATLRYTYGGAGFHGTPGDDAWRAELGLGWSHDYAQRIVPDPVLGSADVWWITPDASMRHYTNLEAGTGLRAYQDTAPSDEHRTLYFDTPTASWELHELDGTIHRFDAAGKWLTTTDRNGNQKVATYTSGKLTQVTMPDGRKELFTYQTHGKLATIQEVGAGVGTCGPSTCRTWTYTYSFDVLRARSRSPTALPGSSITRTAASRAP